jgi:hypothetical protein
MIDADPLTIAQLATDTTQVLLQAGPPADLPTQVPDFVSEIMRAVGSSADGIGEAVSNITPGGSESGAASGVSQIPDQAGPK